MFRVIGLRLPVEGVPVYQLGEYRPMLFEGKKLKFWKRKMRKCERNRKREGILRGKLKSVE
jgi:hypothetical protein